MIQVEKIVSEKDFSNIILHGRIRTEIRRVIFQVTLEDGTKISFWDEDEMRKFVEARNGK